MDNIKKRPGRPLVDPKKPLNIDVNIRVSAEEKKTWEEKAKIKNLNLSAWIRLILNRTED